MPHPKTPSNYVVVSSFIPAEERDRCKAVLKKLGYPSAARWYAIAISRFLDLSEAGRAPAFSATDSPATTPGAPLPPAPSPKA